LTLPAFAAVHHAAAPLLLSAGAYCKRAMQQSILAAGHSAAASQQTRRTPTLRLIDGTDRETDGQTDARPYRPGLRSIWTALIIQ